MTIKGKAYIAGIFEHPTRKADDKSLAQLHAEAAAGAREPGVPERAGGGLGVQLRERFVVGLARGMLKDASDVGLALDRHVRSRDRPPRRAARYT